MREYWSYDKVKRLDNKGNQWHFLNRGFLGGIDEPENLPSELYFRNDERTEFGLLRFEKRKNNPYRNYEVMINKIMNKVEFRKSLLKPETEDVWNRNWK